MFFFFFFLTVAYFYLFFSTRCDAALFTYDFTEKKNKNKNILITTVIRKTCAAIERFNSFFFFSLSYTGVQTGRFTSRSVYRRVRRTILLMVFFDSLVPPTWFTISDAPHVNGEKNSFGSRKLVVADVCRSVPPQVFVSFLYRRFSVL